MVEFFKTDLFQGILNTTIIGLENSLIEHMPPGPQRDYYLWGISDRNPHQAVFLKAIGVTQLSHLTLRLTEGLFCQDQWLRVLDQCALINSFFVYEVISDNLGLGLAGAASRNLGQQTRVDLLSHFNNTMVVALELADVQAKEMMIPLKSVAGQISLFTQSLTSPTLQCLAASYLRLNPDVTVEELEFGLWPFLVANIESARVVVDQISPDELQSFARLSLQQHYQSMNVLMQEQSRDYNDLIWIGSRSVMVVPVLVYYISFIGREMEDQAGYQHIIKDGSLEKVLYDAALLVRLLNDLGTDLLIQTEVERRDFLRIVEQWATEYLSTVTFIELIDLISSQYPQLGRLQKDAAFGEYNMILYGLDMNQPAPDLLPELGKRIAFYADLYQATYQRFIQGIQQLTNSMKDEGITALILRFVKFHELLYSQSGGKEYTL